MVQLGRPWVWRCTDKSIAEGKISVLALAEVFAAMGLYWGLAINLDWPWTQFVALVATPLLLLRSPQSNSRGLTMLGRFVQGSDAISKHRMLIWPWWLLLATIGGFTCAAILMRRYSNMDFTGTIVSLSGLLFGILLAVSALVLGRKWQILRSRALLVVAGIAGFVILIGLKKLFAVGSVPLLAFGGYWLVMVLFVLAFFAVAGGVVVTNDPLLPVDVSWFLGWGALVIALAGVVVTLVWGNNDWLYISFAMLAIIWAVPFGIWLRSLGIRLFATLRYVRAGLTFLPNNWRETLVVVDFTHPPELLPGAASVHRSLTFAGLRESLRSASFKQWPYYLPVLVAWYVPAVAYRWSLKSTAWLWWPLALALRSPFEEGLSGENARRSWVRSVNNLWTWWPRAMGFSMGGVLLWLVIPYFPGLTNWISSLPPDVQTHVKVLNALPALPFGLRMIFLALGCFLGLALLYRAKALSVPYDTVLKTPKAYRDLTDEEKNEAQAFFKPVEKLRHLLVVDIIFGGEAFAVWLLHQHQPQLMERFVAPWLLQWL